MIPFTATKSFSLDLGIATADATANFSLRYVNRALTLHVGVEANFVSGVKGFDIHGHLSLDMNLTTNFHGVNIEGRAHVTGGVKVFGVTKDFDIADATINNSGFSVKLPFSKRLAVKW